MQNVESSELERLIDGKHREVLLHKREIKHRRYKLRKAAAELEQYRRQLKALGIELIGEGDTHGRTKKTQSKIY